MMRPTHLFGVMLPALFLALPLLGGAADRGDKGKDDPLIAAMKFVKVPKGTFWMGGGSAKPPTRQVEIKEDFELAAYTVTQGQWETVMGSGESGGSADLGRILVGPRRRKRHLG